MYQVDEDPEVRTGTISADCPPGDYALRASISLPNNVELASASSRFSVAEPAAEDGTSHEDQPLIAIALSASVEQGTEIIATILFGNLEFDSDTSDTDYIFRADVVGADGCEGDGIGFDRYMYKVDEDPEARTGTISADCPPGGYTLEVSISSPGNEELASASAGFSVEAPPVAQQQQSTDATLSALSVSPVDITGFRGDIDIYNVGLANSVTGVTVNAAANHSGAAIAYKVNNAAHTDADANTPGHQVNNLAVGLTRIRITVTAQDASTTKIYNVYVGRESTAVKGWKAVDDFDGTNAAGNEDPYGIWSDGETMWVADTEDATIYAYRMSDRTRVSGKDFDTLSAAGNRDPAGIWSDGETMWVADTEDGKLYAYRVSDKNRIELPGLSPGCRER